MREEELNRKKEYFLQDLKQQIHAKRNMNY